MGCGFGDPPNAKKNFVPTSPQLINVFLYAGSSTEIVGSPDIYFFPGTLVNLTCVVTSPTQPGRIFWYHQVNPLTLTY
jgi:hypothetical protein